MSGASEAARTAARAWMHGYGIRTERYTSGGSDHPMMDTLPAAFEAFAADLVAKVERLQAALATAEAAIAEACRMRAEAERERRDARADGAAQGEGGDHG